MALQCQIALNKTSYAVGDTYPPLASLVIYNPGASAVVVLGVQVTGDALNSNVKGRTSMAPVNPPCGVGQNVTVPALGTLTIGPMAITVGMGSNQNSFQAIAPNGGNLSILPQVAMPSQFTLMVGAVVYGSDGSYNEAGKLGLLVSYQPPPPDLFQGGAFGFNAPNNFVTGLAVGVL